MEGVKGAEGEAPPSPVPRHMAGQALVKPSSQQ